MGDVKRAYRAADSVPSIPAQSRQGPVGAWGLAVLILLITIFGVFVFANRIRGDWLDDRLLFALPFLWLAGLVWKGVRRE